MGRFLSFAALLAGVSCAKPQPDVNSISGHIKAATDIATKNISSNARACAQIANLQAYGHNIFPADTALACLKSVPLDKDGNALQLAGLKNFFRFQSTLAYLKDPPAGYLYPPVDLMLALPTRIIPRHFLTFETIAGMASMSSAKSSRTTSTTTNTNSSSTYSSSSLLLTMATSLMCRTLLASLRGYA